MFLFSFQEDHLLCTLSGNNVVGRFRLVIISSNTYVCSSPGRFMMTGLRRFPQYLGTKGLGRAVLISTILSVCFLSSACSSNGLARPTMELAVMQFLNPPNPIFPKTQMRRTPPVFMDGCVIFRVLGLCRQPRLGRCRETETKEASRERWLGRGKGRRPGTSPSPFPQTKKY